MLGAAPSAPGHTLTSFIHLHTHSPSAGGRLSRLEIRTFDFRTHFLLPLCGKTGFSTYSTDGICPGDARIIFPKRPVIQFILLPFHSLHPKPTAMLRAQPGPSVTLLHSAGKSIPVKANCPSTSCLNLNGKCGHRQTHRNPRSHCNLITTNPQWALNPGRQSYPPSTYPLSLLENDFTPCPQTSNILLLSSSPKVLTSYFIEKIEAPGGFPQATFTTSACQRRNPAAFPPGCDEVRSSEQAQPSTWALMAQARPLSSALGGGSASCLSSPSSSMIFDLEGFILISK